ncbi:hypothetical protein QE364_003230 [Nocardioides zeae]|uniref:Nuclear transport factor 2 family protein n=2 Tax=Nocardioides zeae TaxID=1457234 RepID=A0AAJ1U1S4_9ACTN|nr:hypothetical protein [Nocardioides zeae]MDQ1106375.1 hypothetical protein [Nocardioides zeae]MDR6173938.1 hypothetical protein [Nocardioides zeae]MDR6211506.1 hypothetical protein [Nocardioides zeae]
MTTFPIRRTLALGAAVLAIAGGGLAASAGISAVAKPAPPHPLTVAETEAWVEELLALPPDEVCELSASKSLCERTLDGAPAGPTGDVATQVDLQDDGTALVTFRGELATGERFHSEIDVLRDADGEVRGIAPVYWWSTVA